MLRGSTRDKGRAPIQHSAEAHDEFVSLSLRDNVWESERACKYIRSGQREGMRYSNNRFGSAIRSKRGRGADEQGI